MTGLAIGGDTGMTEGGYRPAARLVAILTHIAALNVAGGLTLCRGVVMTAGTAPLHLVVIKRQVHKQPVAGIMTTFTCIGGG